MGPTVLVLLAVTGGARAQAVDPAPPDVPPPPPPVVQVEDPPATEGTEWRWERLSPFTLGRVGDVAVGQAGGLVVATRDGACWSSRQGDLWEEELSAFGAGGLALSADEEVLLGIEVRVEELLDEFGDTPFDELEGRPDDEDGAAAEDAASDVTDVAGSPMLAAASEAGDQVQTELVNDPWFLDGAGDGSRAYVVRPRVVAAGGLWLARADGLWRRERLRWTTVLEQPVTAVAEHDGAWIASALGGALLRSTDGLEWAPTVGPPVEHVFDLVSTSMGLLAATDDGLWASPDGGPFVRLGPLSEPVVRVVEGEDRLWVATPETVWWSTDGGLTLQTSSGERLSGVQGLLLWRGGVLATNGRGVWQSPDGDVWTPLVEGIGAVAARGLATDAVGPVVATDVGVYRLVRGAPPRPVGLDDFVPLGHLVASVDRRVEFTQGSGDRIAASLVPSVTVDGWMLRRDSLLYRPELGTDRYIGNELMASVRLTWTPQGRRTYDVDDLVMLSDVSDLSPAVLISGGGAVSVLDESALRVGASTLGRDSVEYRAELSEELGALYRARARLVTEVPESDQLRGHVLRELERLELEALMDALSGGAVGRWQAGRAVVSHDLPGRDDVE